MQTADYLAWRNAVKELKQEQIKPTEMLLQNKARKVECPRSMTQLLVSFKELIDKWAVLSNSDV